MTIMTHLHIFVFVLLVSVTGLEPTLQDITSIACPTEKPYICLPYGMCCRGDEFCYQGSCESCFPRSVQGEGLLEWCQEQGAPNVIQMRHDSCALACYARFNTSVVPKAEAISTQCGSTNTVLIAVCSILTLVVIALVAIIIKLCLCRRTKTHETRPVVESPKEVATNEVNEARETHLIDEQAEVRNIATRRILRQESENAGNAAHPQDIEQTVPLVLTTLT